ncbi:hypothetical protein [Streptococcus ruminantium]|uniref:hypothetical protein n=1 Tax=Streptococcus ruminantium TaxID=1917441 RepID=UPI0012DD0C77|nr:hypothetical protein [Streptococcus ruminantium]
MRKTNNWHEFYEPYISVRNIFDRNTIVDRYIKENYPEIIEEQFEIYKDEGKYKRAGEFIKNEIKAGLRNPDSYFLELKKGNKKNITGILPNIKKLPLIKDYIDDLEDSEYDKDRIYLRECLILGKTLMDYPIYSHYLLWIFSTTDDNSEVFSYGSDYLNKVSKKIKNNVDKLEAINEEDYSISLDCYQKHLNVDSFLSKENVLDLYIKLNYSRLLKDEYKLYIKDFSVNLDTFMRDKDLYDGEDNGRFLFNSLAKGKKKLDSKLLKEFRNFEILTDNNSIHSKKIEKLNHIRTALQMGALAYQKFPNLTTAIVNALKSGSRNIEELSKSFALIAYQMYEEEQSIESEFREEEYYRTHSEEIKIARSIGFDV